MQVHGQSQRLGLRREEFQHRLFVAGDARNAHERRGVARQRIHVECAERRLCHAAGA